VLLAQALVEQVLTVAKYSPLGEPKTTQLESQPQERTYCAGHLVCTAYVCV